MVYFYGIIPTTLVGTQSESTHCDFSSQLLHAAAAVGDRPLSLTGLSVCAGGDSKTFSSPLEPPVICMHGFEWESAVLGVLVPSLHLSYQNRG